MRPAGWSYGDRIKVHRGTVDAGVGDGPRLHPQQARPPEGPQDRPQAHSQERLRPKPHARTAAGGLRPAASQLPGHGHRPPLLRGGPLHHRLRGLDPGDRNAATESCLNRRSTAIRHSGLEPDSREQELSPIQSRAVAHRPGGYGQAGPLLEPLYGGIAANWYNRESHLVVQRHLVLLGMSRGEPSGTRKPC